MAVAVGRPGAASAQAHVAEGSPVFMPKPRRSTAEQHIGPRTSTNSMASSASRRGVSTCLDSSPSKSIDVRAFLPIRTDAKITDRYNIDAKQFAAGGHGKVFKAKDRHFPDMTVVIKKVVCHDEEKTESFRKEVRIMRELDHPNICKVLETYEEGRFMYIVMEECEGGELFDRIADGLAECTTADIIQQICSALLFAHNRKIAHRDLKPENVCFCTADPADLQVKVIDWGLGFHFDAARMKSAVGSLAYAAPEVLEAEDGMPYTSQCDLWSLGTMTYVMLCGRPPFWGSLQKQLNCMKQEKFPMSKAPWPEVSDGAKDFIKALLRNAPEDRLTIEQALNHPWFNTLEPLSPARADTRHVLTNLRSFSNNSRFFSICVASAARQLDHKHLQHIYQVFKKMDTNHDGTIDLQEMRRGFQELYGEGSNEVRLVEETFRELDLDGSGSVDYTEFCAAAMGEKMLMQENVLWSAFKAFDVSGDDGKITKAEIVQVLQKADVRSTWSDAVCDEVAQDIVDKFDEEGVGYLDFGAWLGMMKAAAWEVKRTTSRPMSGGEAEGEWVAWISLDPRKSQLSCYPGNIAWLLEEGFQRGEDYVNLGEKFFGARIYFKGKAGKPFQRTQNGLRDVRRIRLQGRGVADETVTILVTGRVPEVRIQDTPAAWAEERRMTVQPEHAVKAHEVYEAIKQPKSILEASGVSWWRNNSFVSDLETSIRRSLSAASSSSSMRSWWQGGEESSFSRLSVDKKMSGPSLGTGRPPQPADTQRMGRSDSISL